MNLAQVVRPVDMVRQQARQSHLGLHYQASVGDDQEFVTWQLRVDAAPCKEPWVVLAGDDGCLAVAVRAHEGATLVGERTWTDFQDDARLMAWTLQHDVLVERLGALVGRELAPESLTRNPAHRDAALDGPFIVFEAHGHDGQLVARGTLAVDDQDFDRLIGNAEKLLRNKPPHTWGSVPLPLVVRTPALTLPARTLRECRAGDIIVLGQRNRLYQNLQACHANGAPLPVPLRCSLVESDIKIRIDHLPSSPPVHAREELSTMANADVDGATGGADELPDAGTVSANQIPVKLCVQTGAVDVMLGDLEGLEAGVVLPLDAPVAGTNVTILVNGVALGDGELVAAGDKLGVCIKRWRPDGL